MALDVRGLAPLLQVFEMSTSVQFYRDVRGFEVVMKSQPGEHFHWALVRLNGLELMLNSPSSNGYAVQPGNRSTRPLANRRV